MSSYSHVRCLPKEVITMPEKSSIPADAIKYFKVSTYKGTAQILDKATEKTLEQVQKWDATEAEHRKAGG